MARYDSNRKVQRNQALKEYCENNPGSSYAEIGEIFGVSKQRVHQIVSGYRAENREHINERNRRSYRSRTEEQKNQIREQNRIAAKQYNWNLKLRLISFMGGKCKNCGSEDPRILQLNHKDGGGTKELKERGCYALYKDVLSGERKTDDLELLCANCNLIYEYDEGRRFSL